MNDAAHLNALAAGSQLRDYRIERVLGAGGFGITYRAREAITERAVAIKEYLPNALAGRSHDGTTVRPISERDRADYVLGLDRFRREAKVLIGLKHPNIVPILSYFEANGTGYLVMEFEEGKSLGELIANGKTLGEDELGEIMAPLLDGIEAVHMRQFLHRDIKPDNIFIRLNGSPVLLDFGAARQALAQNSKSLTAILTEGYAPYEQYQRDGNQGPWTDIHALGAVMFRCLLGRRPVEAPKRIAARVAGKPDPLESDLESLARVCSPAMAAAVRAALGVTEGERPQSIADLRKILNAPGSGSHEPSRLATDPGTLAPERRAGSERAVAPAPRGAVSRRRRTALVAGLALLVLAAAGTAAYVALDRGTPSRDDTAAATDVKRTAEEAARKRAEEERARAEAEARRKSEEQAARKREEEERVRTETARREEEARRQEEARRDEEARRRAAAAGPIKIGVIHSLSGVMAISETTLKDTILMLIDAQNAKGGVLGRRLEPVVVDPASNWPLFAERTRDLLQREKVAVLFGGWTSVSRKSMLPVLEELNGLLFYPVRYEGEESSRNIFYTGAVPNQHAIPAAEYLLSREGGAARRWVLVGTDYVYPRTTNRILRGFLRSKGVAASDIMEEYTPFGHSDWQTIVRRVKEFAAQGKKTVVVSTINGDANLPFYQELARQGIAPADIRVMSLSLDEEELGAVDIKPFVGHLAAANYFQSAKGAANEAFIGQWRAFIRNPQRVTIDAMEGHYIGFHMWVEAVRQAGTTDVDAVRQAMHGQKFRSPSGYEVVMHPNHHLAKPAVIGTIRDDRQLDIVWQSNGVLAAQTESPFLR